MPKTFARLSRPPQLIASFRDRRTLPDTSALSRPTQRPCYLPFIAEKLADIKLVPVETLLTHARDNSHQLFFNP